MAQKIRFLVVLGLLVVQIVLSTSAQEYEPIPTTMFERSIVRSGPGNTYAEVGVLGSEIAVTILERNFIGNWLLIYRAPAPGGEPVEGWVMTGFVNLPDDLVFSKLPVNEDLPDADTESVPDPDIERLYDVPIIPEMSDEVVEIFERGQENNLNPDVVTKVGDSNSVAAGYLPPLNGDNYDLGPYDFLQETVDFYAQSFQTGSFAAKVGMNAFSVFDPIWSDPDDCEPNESPLECEYRNSHPAISLIFFGPNDLKVLNTTQFEEQLSLIVETSLQRGIIPVLSTFSSNPDLDTWFQAVRFNLIILDVGEAYEIPVVNLWSAARALPRYGIGDDNIHLTAPGVSVKFGSNESRFGISLQNLIVLHTLDAIRLKLESAESA